MNPLSDLYVGAAHRSGGMVGGIFRRTGDDNRWDRLDRGLPPTTNVHAITVHPTNRNIVYIGTQNGLYRSTDRGEHWEHLDFPGGSRQVWSLLVHPANPRILYAGTSPVGVYRSEDGGDTWRQLPRALSAEQVKMSFACRVMRLAADPARPDDLYATLEVGGVMRSLDGGESWTDCNAALLELAQRPHLKSRIESDTDVEGMFDGHAVCVSAARPGTVFLAVRMGLFRSDDRGASWQDMEVGRFSPLTYARDVRVAPDDPQVLYACLSAAAQSENGALYRSQDLGETWVRFDHGVKATRTMMAVALQPEDPDQVYCVARGGQVFGTQDGGRSWQGQSLPDHVQDVYAIACA